MKLPDLSNALFARKGNGLSHGGAGETAKAGGSAVGIAPSGECGCSRNRHCLGPCVMGSCLGSCIPNI